MNTYINGCIQNNFFNRNNIKIEKYTMNYLFCHDRKINKEESQFREALNVTRVDELLDIYKDIKDENKKKIFEQLLTQPGVMDHGRQSMNLIIREKYMSSFNLYITNTPDEIDCISIRESLVTGCIPLISNFGVFKSREGIHFELKDEIECYQNIGAKILEILEQNNKLDWYRDKIKKSPLIITWDNVAKEWFRN
jgi:hypothetical protein